MHRPIEKPAASVAAWKHAILVGSLVAATLLAYSNNFTAGFVYDDLPFIVDNPAVRSLSNIGRFFIDRESFSEGGQYIIFRPLATLTFAVNHSLSGYNPIPFHAVNILWHAACGLLLYVLFFQVLRNATFAFFSSLFFLLHPMQTEAVAWIAARGNSMFLSFSLVTVMCYRQWVIRDRLRGLFYGLAVVSFALALLSKEMAVVLPFLLVVLDATLNRPDKLAQWKGRLLAILPLLGLSLGYVILRHLVLGETRQIGYWGGSLWTAMLTTLKGFTYYIRLLFIPMPQTVEYSVPITHSLFQPTAIISLVVLGVLAGVCFVTYRRAPTVSFGIAWFYVSLLPVSNIVPLKAIMNERFLYLPSIGYCAILASPFLMGRSTLSRRRFNAIAVALSAIALCYGTLTFNRNKDWSDSFSLWTASVEVSPAGPTSRYNLGVELYKRGRYKEAEEHLKLACQLQEIFPLAHGTLGNVYYAQKRFEESIREYQIGLEQAPGHPTMARNLAVAWLRKGERHAERGEIRMAIGSFENALKYEPSFQQAERALKKIRIEHHGE